MKSHWRVCGVFVGAFIVCAPAGAATVVVNFDGINTSGGTVIGSPVSSYLQSFGITFTAGAGAPEPLVEPAPVWMPAPSAPNNFGTTGPANGLSYTLTFSTPLDSLSLTRPQLIATTPSGVTMATWSATAYDAGNAVLGSVGEPLLASFGTIAAQTFTISGPNIHHVVITSDAQNFAGTNFKFDNLTLSGSGVTPPPPPPPPVGNHACPSEIMAPEVGSLAGIANWTLDYEVTPNDGLVVRNVRLGSRYMAESMSVPYYMLGRGASAQRCELSPNGSSPCRSQLVRFESGARSRPTAEGVLVHYALVSATYEVDDLPGAPDVCLRITQRYEFAEELDPNAAPSEACEPSKSLSCAKFRPMVSYEFIAPSGTTYSTDINVVQRMAFVVDGRFPNSSAIFHDCKTGPCLDKPKTAISPLHNENPLFSEDAVVAIRSGKGTQWDNYHQTWKPSIEEPVTVPAAPGCPECVHIHWRWGLAASLKSASIGGPDLGGGLPLILPGSNQDVVVAVTLSRPGETHPSDFQPLVNREQLNPGVPVFWHSATGHQPSDTFFLYGGFFLSNP